MALMLIGGGPDVMSEVRTALKKAKIRYIDTQMEINMILGNIYERNQLVAGKCVNQSTSKCD